MQSHSALLGEDNVVHPATCSPPVLYHLPRIYSLATILQSQTMKALHSICREHASGCDVILRLSSH